MKLVDPIQVRVRLDADGEVLAGRVKGEACFRKRIEPHLGDQKIFVLSFQGVAYVTASFLKAVWGPLMEIQVPGLVADLNQESRNEVDVFLRGMRVPGLEVVKSGDPLPKRGKVLGHMEKPLRVALDRVVAAPGATAPSLHAADDDGVSVTGWNNRLTELWHVGLALRTKHNRAWHYYATVEEVDHG